MYPLSFGIDVLKSATPTSYGEVPSVFIMPTHITDIREFRSHFIKFWAVGRYLDTRTCLVRVGSLRGEDPTSSRLRRDENDGQMSKKSMFFAVFDPFPGTRGSTEHR